MKQVFIMASRHTSAQYYAKFVLNISPKEWEYVHFIQDLYGRRGPDNLLILTMEHWRQRDSWEIVQLAQSLGITIVRHTL